MAGGLHVVADLEAVGPALDGRPVQHVAGVQDLRAQPGKAMKVVAQQDDDRLGEERGEVPGDGIGDAGDEPVRSVGDGSGGGDAGQEVAECLGHYPASVGAVHPGDEVAHELRAQRERVSGGGQHRGVAAVVPMVAGGVSADQGEVLVLSRDDVPAEADAVRADFGPGAGLPDDLGVGGDLQQQIQELARSFQTEAEFGLGALPGQSQCGPERAQPGRTDLPRCEHHVVRVQRHRLCPAVAGDPDLPAVAGGG